MKTGATLDCAGSAWRNDRDTCGADMIVSYCHQEIAAGYAKLLSRTSLVGRLQMKRFYECFLLPLSSKLDDLAAKRTQRTFHDLPGS
jgi:hypothetical protein